MEKCIHHPEREAEYRCQKHQIHLCDGCRACPDPQLYCKFREGCIIWFMEKKPLD